MDACRYLDDGYRQESKQWPNTSGCYLFGSASIKENKFILRKSLLLPIDWNNDIFMIKCVDGDPIPLGCALCKGKAMLHFDYEKAGLIEHQQLSIIPSKVRT
jgi:hypothetical protein